MSRPDFTLSRTAPDNLLEFHNRQGRIVAVFRADQHNTEYSNIDEVDSDTYTDAGRTTDSAYKARYRDVNASVRIVNNFSNLTPPYYEAEPKGDSTFTLDTFSFNPSWGPAVTVDIITVGNFQLGKESIKKFTKA